MSGAGRAGHGPFAAPPAPPAPPAPFLSADSALVHGLVAELKSHGIFDQFRKECIADVDTKPAYQNLRQRVESTVTAFLNLQTWSSNLNKNQLREKLRKHILDSNFLDQGVERIVDQVVNPKIATVFLPQIEELVCKSLGLQKPEKATNGVHDTPEKAPPAKDLLPNDLESVSPESVKSHKSADNKPIDVSLEDDKRVALVSDVDDKVSIKSELKHNPSEDSDNSEEFESPAFEPLEATVKEDANSKDSHMSGISDLTSHESNESKTNAEISLKPDLQNTNSQPSNVSNLSSDVLYSNNRITSSDADKNVSEPMEIEISNDDNASDARQFFENSIKEEETVMIESETKEERSSTPERKESLCLKSENNFEMEVESNESNSVFTPSKNEVDGKENSFENKINILINAKSSESAEAAVKNETEVVENAASDEKLKDDRSSDRCEKDKEKSGSKSSKDVKGDELKHRSRSSHSRHGSSGKHHSERRHSSSHDKRDSDPKSSHKDSSYDSKSKDKHRHSGNGDRERRSTSHKTSARRRSSKHSSADKNTSDRHSKDDRHDKNKDNRSSSKSTGNKEKDSKSDSSSDRNKNNSTSKHADRSSKDDKRHKSRSGKDDYCSTTKSNRTRRSTDRDSNDGSNAHGKGSNLNTTGVSSRHAQKSKSGTVENSSSGNVSSGQSDSLKDTVNITAGSYIKSDFDMFQFGTMNAMRKQSMADKSPLSRFPERSPPPKFPEESLSPTPPSSESPGAKTPEKIVDKPPHIESPKSAPKSNTVDKSATDMIDSDEVRCKKPIIHIDNHLKPIKFDSEIFYKTDHLGNIKKPKCASNIREARELIKIRKKIGEIERKKKQEAILQMERLNNVPMNASLAFSDASGPEFELAYMKSDTEAAPKLKRSPERTELGFRYFNQKFIGKLTDRIGLIQNQITRLEKELGIKSSIPRNGFIEKKTEPSPKQKTPNKRGGAPSLDDSAENENFDLDYYKSLDTLLEKKSKQDIMEIILGGESNLDDTMVYLNSEKKSIAVSVKPIQEPDREQRKARTSVRLKRRRMSASTSSDNYGDDSDEKRSHNNNLIDGVNKSKRRKTRLSSETRAKNAVSRDMSNSPDSDKSIENHIDLNQTKTHAPVKVSNRNKQFKQSNNILKINPKNCDKFNTALYENKLKRSDTAHRKIIIGD